MNKQFYTMDELAGRQVELEVNMKVAGVDRFHLNADRAITEGSASETEWNRRIIQELTNPMAEAISAYLDYYQGRRGKPSKTLTYLRTCDPRTASFITIKNILDGLTRETELMTLAKTIGSRIEDQVRFAGMAEAAPRYVEKVQKTLRQANSKQYRHKSAVLAHAESALVKGNSSKDMEPQPELEWKAWPENDITQLGSKLIDIFAENVLFEGEQVIMKHVVKTTANKKVKSKAYLQPTAHLEGWIDKYKSVMEVLTPAFAPCVVPPREWLTPTVGGYHIPEVAETLPMIKCRRSQRKRLTKKQMPEVYEALNTLQNVRWQISDRTLDVAQHCIRLGLSLGIPGRDPYEIPEAPIPEHLRELRGPELKAAMNEEEWDDFIKWKRSSTQLYELEQKRKSSFMKILRTMGSAEQYREYEALHFVYTLDFRGRVYCKSDSVSPQGDDVQKGLIRFADGMKLGAEGMYWLAVQGANVWGEDKCTFDERVAWVGKHSDDIRDMAADPITYTEWAAADKPYQFLNWCFEWADLMDWIEDGNDLKDFESHIPVAMDGSCSGIQHYSAILRDPVGGAAVNLVPDTKPHDIYGDVAVISTLKFEVMVKTDEEQIRRDAAAGWLMVYGGVSRGLCKPPVMTLPYGSTQIRCLDTTGAYLAELQVKTDKGQKAKGEPTFKVHPFSVAKGEPGVSRFEAEKIGSSVIWGSIGEVVVAAREGMKYIQDVARDVAKAGFPLEWVTPTGFIVEQRELEYKSRRVKTQLMGETFMSLKEETTKINVRKMKSSAAPNFIHSMDASHLIKAVNAFKLAGINSIAVIHDSFGTYAAQTPILRKALVDSFVDMYLEHDVLTDFKEYNEGLICAEIDVDVPQTMGLDLEDVRKSLYAFA